MNISVELYWSFNEGFTILENGFKIVDSCDNFDIRTLETLYIHKLKPSMNKQCNSTDLFIVNMNHCQSFALFTLFNFQ